jgi:hypothetical protein
MNVYRDDHGVYAYAATLIAAIEPFQIRSVTVTPSLTAMLARPYRRS